MTRDWGRIIVGTRLEKQISSKFLQVWSELITQGLDREDGFLIVRGLVAHKAANALVRLFLKTEADTLWMLDSDADNIEPDFLRRFRSYEEGQKFDMLQAFYTRRGWPPRAIWMQKNALGQMMEMSVLDDDKTEEVDICGTHCALIRREVFETMLGDNDPESFEWFHYPRHTHDSEDGAFSRDAQEHGFRIGATTHVKAGHISEITTGWETYQEYLEFSGSLPLIQRYSELAQMVGQFIGESPDVVVAKAAQGYSNVKSAWEQFKPRSADGVRSFYGRYDNGYLYDLTSWNCQPIYEQIIAPLRYVHGKRVLVIGAGLGTEAALLADEGNNVTAFELTGVLADFLARRFAMDGRVKVVSSDSLIMGVPDPHGFDMVVAVDTLEHVHPDEIQETLAEIDLLLAPHGELYAHNNWGDTDKYPMHYDHSETFAQWCDAVGLVQKGKLLWSR